MTRLRVMSDLHLEFGRLDLEPAGEDVLVLAGDVGLGTAGAEWALAYARRTDVPVVMVAGNHEFYRQRGNPDEYTVGSTHLALALLAERSGGALTFLDDETATVVGVTFVGATLWTDYQLDGEYSKPHAMVTAKFAMNDHRLIYEASGHRFTPEDALRRHERSRAFLAKSLLKSAVVVTHHLPSRRSIAAEYLSGDHAALNPAYASNLDDVVAGSGAALWVHGHTHASADYLLGGTRVLCNPRGYWPDDLNPRFDPTLVVEVGS